MRNERAPAAAAAAATAATAAVAAATATAASASATGRARAGRGVAARSGSVHSLRYLVHREPGKRPRGNTVLHVYYGVVRRLGIVLLAHLWHILHMPLGHMAVVARVLPCFF
jgi:hypothetical protein